MFHHHEHVLCSILWKWKCYMFVYLMIAKKTAAVTIFLQTNICSYIYCYICNDLMVTDQLLAVQFYASACFEVKHRKECLLSSLRAQRFFILRRGGWYNKVKAYVLSTNTNYRTYLPTILFHDDTPKPKPHRLLFICIKFYWLWNWQGRMCRCMEPVYGLFVTEDAAKKMNVMPFFTCNMN